MKEVETGGPAFPVGSGDMRDPMGMTLRDYFAGQALAGMACTDYAWSISSEKLAGYAYDAADAMLAARKGVQHD